MTTFDLKGENINAAIEAIKALDLSEDTSIMEVGMACLMVVYSILHDQGGFRGPILIAEMNSMMEWLMKNSIKKGSIHDVSNKNPN